MLLFKRLLILLSLFIINYCFSQSVSTTSLTSYLKNYKLHEVIDVKSSNDTLTIFGYDKNDVLNLRKIKLNRYQVFSITAYSLPFKKGHWKPLPISLITIPFKVRPKNKYKSSTASSGINNLGFNLNFIEVERNRYFWTGFKSNHKFSLGIWAAPMVEKLNSETTKNYLKDENEVSQFFISTGLTINYTYNNISFSFVPIGFDYATSTIGKEWIYNQKRWWGFGIGLEPKFLQSLMNK